MIACRECRDIQHSSEEGKAAMRAHWLIKHGRKARVADIEVLGAASPPPYSRSERPRMIFT